MYAKYNMNPYNFLIKSEAIRKSSRSEQLQLTNTNIIMFNIIIILSKVCAVQFEQSTQSSNYIGSIPLESHNKLVAAVWASWACVVALAVTFSATTCNHDVIVPTAA